MKKHRYLSIVALVGFCMSAFTAQAAGNSKTWQKWQSNPLDIPVVIAFTNLLAASNSTLHVTFGELEQTMYGLGCDVPTNGPALINGLKPDKHYTLTVIASNLTQLDLLISLKPPWQPLAANGAAAAPKQYYLTVDGDMSSEDRYFSVGSSCNYYSNTWDILVRGQRAAKGRVEGGADDSKSAPGDAVSLNLGPGKSLQTNRMAFEWQVSLGRLFDGLAAGQLRMRENQLGSNVYNGTALYYAAKSEVIQNQVKLLSYPGSSNLRQVRAFQTFVDIVTNQSQTELRFYLPDQIGVETNGYGFYTNITGPQFVTWTIRNPNPATSNQLAIIETRNGFSRTNSLTFNPTNTIETWSARYGTGNEERVESRGVAINLSPYTNRVETVTTRYANSNVAAYRCQETYRLFDWGWEIVESRIDPDNNPGTADDLVTSMDYYTDSGDPFTYRQLKALHQPNGQWERRLYGGPYDDFPGVLLYVVRPWMDSAEPENDGFDINDYQVNEYFWWWDGRSLYPYWLLQKGPGGVYIEKDYLLDEASYPDGTFETTDHTTTSPYSGDGTAAEGVYSRSYGQSYGPGLAHHPYGLREAPNPESMFYYDRGCYDPTNLSFEVDNVEEHSITNLDWRQTRIFEHPFFWSVHLTGEETRETYVTLPTGIDTPEPETWTSTQSSNLKALQEPMQSKAESSIYHKGSLAQKDLLVFTGLDGEDAPTWEPYQRYSFKNDALGHLTNVTLVDIANPAIKRTIYEADYKGTNTFEGDLLLWESDESGGRSDYRYDSLKRLVANTKKGITSGPVVQSDIVTNILYDAANREVSMIVSAAGLSLTNLIQYDLAGRVTSATDPTGLTMAKNYPNGGKQEVFTLSSSSTITNTYYLDGRLASKTGAGVVNEFHDYTAVTHATAPVNALLDQVAFGSPSSTRIQKNYIDGFRHLCLRETLDFDVDTIAETWCYSYAGLLRHSKSGQPDQRYVYDCDGQVAWNVRGFFAYDDYSFTSGRVTRSLRQFSKVSGEWFLTETNLAYYEDSSGVPTVTSVSRQRLSGFPSASVLSEVTSWDADSNATVVTTFVDRTAKQVTQVADVAQSTLNATNVTVNGLLQSESTPTVGTATRHYYDGLGRETSVVSPLGFPATVIYNQNNQVTSTTDFTGNNTSYEYYPNSQAGAGKVKCETRNGKKTYYSYTARDEVWRTWGDLPYPEERVYSDYGELVELRTFRLGTGWNASAWPAGTTGSYDSTFWIFQTHSGLLTNKTDSAGRSVSYTYANGMLLARSWARGISVTNSYSDFADLTRQDYTDGTPAVQFNNYNRAGLPREIIDVTGTNTFVYDHALRMISVTCDNGMFAGVAVSNHFNGLNGRDMLRVSGTSTLLTNGFGYDTYGRMASVTNGIYSATYGYLPNSDLLQTTTCKSNSTTILTTGRSWEYGMRLGAILNQVDGVNISSHSYTYDALNRRTRASLEDGSYWRYDYNDRNELTGAKRYWPDMIPVTGQFFGYDYDNIGNRKTAQSGGDASGGNLRTTSYTANGLNQYTGIATPGYEDIIGVAIATNGVAVNGGTADRKTEYFHREISVANGSGPLCTNVTVASSVTTNTGGLIIPDDNQTLTYDLDGNLSFDGVWSYRWDGENRLASMQMTNVVSIANSNRLKLDFAYDFMGRRVRKVVSVWDSPTLNYQPSTTNLFIYDGWNLVAILNHQSSILQSFTWGQDLSGTMTKGGGVGALLLATISGTNSFVCYDGNGNITALMDAVAKSTNARYEYNPFGKLIRATGFLARANPFRFSTKFADEESGLVYYGYRYYSPSQGKWLGRDPTTDQIFLNLYLFCNNNCVNGYDSDGREFNLTAETFVAGIEAFLVSRVAGGIFGASTGFVGSVMALAKERGGYENFTGADWNTIMKATTIGWMAGVVSGGISGGLTLFQAVAVNLSAGALTGAAGSLLVDWISDPDTF